MKCKFHFLRTSAPTCQDYDPCARPSAPLPPPGVDEGRVVEITIGLICGVIFLAVLLFVWVKLVINSSNKLKVLCGKSFLLFILERQQISTGQTNQRASL